MRWGVAYLLCAGIPAVAGLAEPRQGRLPSGVQDVCRSDWHCLDAAFREGMATRDFSLLKNLLDRMFSSKDAAIRDLAMGWLGRHERDFTMQEQIEFDELYIGVSPDNETRRTVLNMLARRKLAILPRDERAKVYWHAVQSGSVNIGSQDPLPRLSALTAAAADGLEEFESAIKKYAAVLDKERQVDLGVNRSDELLWMLRMRAGAKDRLEAEQLHAQGLAKIGAEAFAENMTKDPAFRATTEALADSSCEKFKATNACKTLAEVYLQQEEFRMAGVAVIKERKGGAISVTEQGRSEEPPWLGALREATKSVRVAGRLEQEQEKKGRPEPRPEPKE